MKTIQNGLYADGRRGSGKLTSLRKKHLFNLAVKSRRAVSAQRDADSV